MAAPMKSDVSHKTDMAKTQNRDAKLNNRKWRETQFKKNVGNLSEGQGFADERKREIVRRYRKLTKRNRSTTTAPEQSSLDDGQHPLDSDQAAGSSKTSMKPKMGKFQKAKLENRQRTETKFNQIQAISRVKQERETALKRYKERKLERNRKLLKFTKKGQPIMKGRIELLLDTLQRQLTSEEAARKRDAMT